MYLLSACLVAVSLAIQAAFAWFGHMLNPEIQVAISYLYDILKNVGHIKFWQNMLLEEFNLSFEHITTC